MKKVLVLFSLLALVVNMGFSVDYVAEGKKYAALARDVFGNNKLDHILYRIEKAADGLGKISTGLDSYKYLKSFSEVVRWANRYKDAKTDIEFEVAGREANKSMLKMLEAFASLAGGPLYGLILPTLLKGVDQAVNAIHYRKAQQQYVEWVSDPYSYRNGNKYHGWDWPAVAAAGYHGIAVEVIAKYDGPLLPLAAVVQIIEWLEELK